MATQDYLQKIRSTFVPGNFPGASAPPRAAPKPQVQQKKAAPKPSLLGRALNVAKGVGRGATTGERAFAGGIARVLPGGTADIEAERRASEQASRNINVAHNLYKAGKINKQSFINLTKHAAGDVNMSNQNLHQIIQQMPTRGQIAAGALATIFDVVTAGTGKLVTQGTKYAAEAGLRKGAVATAERFATKVPAKVAVPAATAGAGASSAAAGGGNRRQILENAALGGTAPIVLRGLGSAITRARTRAPAVSAKVVPSAKTPVLPEVAANLPAKENIVNRGAKKVGGVISAGASKTIRATETGAKVADKVQAVKENLLRNWSDSLQPVRSTLQAAERTGTVRKGATTSLDLAASQTKRAVAQANEFIDNHPVMRALHENIAKIAPGNKRAVNSFGDYAAAKRELQLINQGRKVENPGRGYTKAAFQDRITQLEQKYGKDNLAGAYRSLVDANKEVTSMLKGSGLSEQGFNDMLKSDPEYIRMQRQLPEYRLNRPAARTSSRANPSEQRINQFATQNALHPVAALYDKAQRVAQYVEQNKVNSIAAKHLIEAGEAKPLPIPKTEGAPVSKLPHITYWENGVKKAAQVDPAIEAAVKGFNEQQMNAFFNASRKLNNIFKYGTTQGNPAFAIPNFVRDQLGSFVASENALRTHNPLNIINSLYNGFKVAYGKELRDPVMNDFAKSLQGATRFDINRNLRGAVRDVGRNVSKERQIPGRVRNITVGGSGKSLRENWEALTTALEYATRLQNAKGTYKYYLSKGVAKDAAEGRAILAGLRNTADFSITGDTGRLINTMSPFFNARIQGIKTLTRALKDRPVTTSAKLLMLASPVVYATHYNLSDPERAKIYADTPQYIRDSNIVLVIGNKRILIPLPQDIRGFTAPIRQTIEARFAYDPTSFRKIAKGMLDTFSPVDTTSVGSALTSFVPGPAKTGIEIAANKSFFTGREIVPQSIKDKGGPQQQVFKTTSASAKALGKLLGVSPIQVDYALKQTFGELGGQNIPTTAAQVAGVKQPGGRSFKESITRRFMNTSGGNVNQQFYDVYNKVQNDKKATNNQITAALKSGNHDQAYKLANTYNQSVDRQFSSFKRTYGGVAGKDMTDRINKSKIKLTDRGIKARLRNAAKKSGQ